jgi:uncharacterized iron-regulated membrane protein
MSSTSLPQRDAVASTRLYRAIWRWHFYAGLIVVPFLITPAVTGLIMVFGNSIESFLGKKHYVAPGGERASIVQQALVAQSAVPKTILGIAAVVSAVFPLTGLSIITFAIIDFLIPKRLKQAGFQNAST